MLSPARTFELVIHRDLGAAEPQWRTLERSGAVSTPYQRFDLLGPWQKHVGARTGVTPVLVLGLDRAGAPAFLLPFGRRRVRHLDVVEFLGGKHANFNFGVWRREIAATLSESEMRAIVRRVGTDVGADLLALYRQPVAWDGIANPFTLLPHQPSGNQATRLTFAQRSSDVLADILSTSTRAKLRSKQRKLERLPGYRLVRAGSRQDVERLLRAFFCIKAQRLSAHGLSNVFAEDGVQDFLREACLSGVEEGRPTIEIMALEGDGDLLALFAGITDGRRFSCMFNTYTLGEHARHSPGLILLRDLVASCHARGMTSFDIGIGLEPYKAFFCREPEPMFDSFLPLGRLGHVAAPFFRGLASAQRVVKETPALWSAVQAVRRMRGRHATETDDTASAA